MINMDQGGVDQELILDKVRTKLREDSVKLWLPPYTTETQERGEVPLELIMRYSKVLNLKEDVVATAVESLRIHALAKLAERNKFQTTGIATVKVKLAMGQKDSLKRVISLEVSLEKSGFDLKYAVSQETGLDRIRLKLICAGKVISDAQTLTAQNIKNGSQVMAVVLTETEGQARQKEEEICDVSRTRQAAELLSTRAENDDVDEFDIRIADQSGRTLQLPKEERKSLTLAMTLHEKGRAALKAKNYSKALLLLLEADKEFRSCRAEILDKVDNFAILCLDIVWCYLCLENVSELPDADRRLHQCETMFLKSYGHNNERLKLLKNGAEVERILLMRLHLLQGIVAFHQHNTDVAQRLLRQAMDEYNGLQVNPEALAHLMELGFSAREGRLGMRACQGNVAAAAEYIMKQRQDQAELLKKEKQERDDRKLAKKYGNCANGERLNMQNVNMMVQMMYPRAAAAEALKQTNNNVERAIDVLQDHPELMELPDVRDDKGPPLDLRDTDIAQVVSLGFEAEAAKTALRRHRNNVQKAVDDLIKYNGHLPYTSDESEGSSSGSESPDKDLAARKREEENQVLDELISDISRDESDHLDFEMTDERQFLEDYLAKMSSV
ncbi:NEDD8 ultimate buster 1-like [Babylonia areolata]|uniref:NEDD8 ultimate buster 1-like n=1 Tax=Babylonia areolata TaxID=304850 RepID=UPI003FCFFAFB